MDLTTATLFSLLLLLSVLARPVRMQVFFDESECTSVGSPSCYESDPTHQWNVELDQCSHDDSVRVIYSDYSGEDGRVLVEPKYQEIRLECTEPEGVAQAAHNMSAASVDCSGKSTGGDQSLGFVFQNLNASGIQPGWTCVIRGCYKLELPRGDNVWVQTPPRNFTVGCVDPTTASPTTTVAATTTETTTERSTTTESVTTTDINATIKIDKTTERSTTVTTENETTEMDTTTERSTTTENATKDMYTAILIPILSVIVFPIILLILFAIFSWKKLQNDRKRKNLILIVDKNNMVFDPDYFPAVCIDKPACHRFSMVSIDGLQYLNPVEDTGFHGSEKLPILSEGSFDGDDVISQIHNTTSISVATITIEADGSPQECSGSDCVSTHLESPPPPDYASLCNTELTLHAGCETVSGYLRDAEPHRECDTQVVTNAHSETNISANLDTQSKDSCSVLLQPISLNGGLVTTNLDGEYNSFSSGYIEPPCLSASQKSQQSRGSVLKTDLEDNDSDNQPLFSSSAVRSNDTPSSYVDSAQFETQNTHYRGDNHNEGFDLDSSYVLSDDSGMSRGPPLSVSPSSMHRQQTPATSQSVEHYDRTTDTDGYVLYGEAPPTDSRYSEGEDESLLELDFATESDSTSSETLKDKKQQPLADLSIHDQNRLNKQLEESSTTKKDRHLQKSTFIDGFTQSQGYVVCDDVISTNRKIVVPTLSSESDPGFVVHLDFDYQTRNSTPKIGAGYQELKKNSTVESKKSLDASAGDICPVDDSSSQENGEYIVYDFRPLRHLLTDNSGADCLPMIVPLDDQNNSESVKLEPLLAYYPSNGSS